MVELKREFSRKGVQFTQVFKNEALCLYQLAKTHIDGVTSQWYEIFKRKVMKPDRFHDDEYEAYPSDESFGVWAWCCSDKKIVEKVLKREFPGENHQEIMSNC